MAATYIQPMQYPPDVEETRQKLRLRLQSRIPSAVMHLMGTRRVNKCFEDLFGMLQSETFMLQVCW